LERTVPDQFRSLRSVFEEHLRLVAAAWIAARPDVRASLTADLAKLALEPAAERSLSFVLTWETAADDVNLFLDPGRALTGNADSLFDFPGALWTDARDGFGPEVFVIEEPKAARRVRLGVQRSRLGPQGYSFGNVELIRHDGAGGLSFEQRPFALMSDHGYADLGAVSF